MFNSIISQLLVWSLQIKNQTQKYGNTETLVGGLFEQIIALIKSIADYISNIIFGFIRQPGVDTYNNTSGGKTSLLNSYPVPEKGWTVLVRNDETNEGQATLYQWNGTAWINLETAVYESDIMLSGGTLKTGQQLDNEKSYVYDTYSLGRKPDVLLGKVYAFGGANRGDLQTNANYDCIFGLRVLGKNLTVSGNTVQSYIFYTDIPLNKDTYLSQNITGIIPSGAKYIGVNFEKSANTSGYDNLMVTFGKSAAFVEELNAVKDSSDRIFSPFYVEPKFQNDSNQTIFGYGTEIKGNGKTITKLYLKKGKSSLTQTVNLSIKFIEVSNGVETLIQDLSYPYDKFNTLEDGETFSVTLSASKTLEAGKTYIVRYYSTTYLSLMKQATNTNVNVVRGMFSTDGTSWITIGVPQGSYGIWVDIDLQPKSVLPLNIIPKDVSRLTGLNNMIKMLAKGTDVSNISIPILKAEKDIYLNLWSDSVGAFQSTWVSAIEGVTNVPPVCDRQGFAYHLFKSLVFGSPVYCRFDKGKKSLVGNWDASLADDSTAFFTESGTFNTAYCRDSVLNPAWRTRPQYTSEITGGFTQQFDSSESVQQQRNIPKRFANAANGSVQFTIPAGYSKFDFLYHAHVLGDTVTITTNRSNGIVKMHNKQNDWGNAVEANGATFNLTKQSTGSNTDAYGLPNKRIFFQLSDTNVPTTVTVTKSADTSKYLIYWGISYWGTPSQPYALHLNCLGRGGASLSTLAAVRSTDITESNPDLLLMEITCINNLGLTPTGDGTTRKNTLVSGIELLHDFFTTSNIPVAYYIPHLTKGISQNYYNIGKEFYNLANGTLRGLDAIIVGDVHILMRSVWESYYSDVTYYDFVDSIMFDGTHPNENGFLFYKVLSENILK